jgi:hypothetical protein
MIIDVWRPRIKKVNGKGIAVSYEMVDIGVFIKEKRKGWIVRYYCDSCKNDKIMTTTTHVLLNPKVVYNTLEKQTCRSCRSKISEYEIKKSHIPFDVIEKSVIESNYTLLSTEDEYMLWGQKSQFKHKVICENNHNLTITWNNWSKGKRCRQCYEQKKFENAVKYKEGWERYSYLVYYYTEKSYKKYKNKINPTNIERSKEYHLDHKYSISEGFGNGILPNIIGQFYNLEILKSHDNLKKNKQCSITLDELFEYEKTYKRIGD